jgi:hypothetical protein
MWARAGQIMFRKLILVAVLLSVTSNATARAEELKGEVNIQTKIPPIRLQRPLQLEASKTKILESTTFSAGPVLQHNAGTNFDDSFRDFDGEKQTPTPATFDVPTGIAPLQLQSGSGKSELKAAAPAPTTSNPASAQPEPNYNYQAKSPLSGSITVRMTNYRVEPNVYALRMANYWLTRGVKVTVMLDKQTPLIANKHNIEGVEINNKIVGIKDQLIKFIQSGGRVIMNKYWADKFLVNASNMHEGIQILSEDEINDELFIRRGEIVEY